MELPHRYLDSVFACLHSMSWAANEGCRLPAEHYYILKYEELVEEPEAILRKLCRFLDVDFEPQMLDPARFTDRTGRTIWEANSAFGDMTLEDGIALHTVGRWRESLEAFEVLFCRKHHRRANGPVWIRGFQGKG